MRDMMFASCAVPAYGMDDTGQLSASRAVTGMVPGSRFEVREGYLESGRKGTYLGACITDPSTVIVLFDGDDEHTAVIPQALRHMKMTRNEQMALAVSDFTALGGGPKAMAAVLMAWDSRAYEL